MSAKRIRTSKHEGNSLRGRTVDVAVGAQQEVFSVHETLIRASSSFFDKAMEGEWKESQERTIRLPDNEPGIFALYVNWLYCGTLPVVCDEPGLPGNFEYIDLVKAYILGDEILDSKFQDTVIDAIVDKSQSKAKDGKCLSKYRRDNVYLQEHERVGPDSQSTGGYVRRFCTQFMDL